MADNPNPNPNLNQRQFLYHATFPHNRDSIAQLGLLTENSNDDPEYGSPEIYLSDKPSKSPHEDVWRADVTGYHRRIDGDSGEDPAYLGRSWAVQNDIPPARLALHRKAGNG